VYEFIRRQGTDANDAEDLTQDFFTGVLQRRDIAKAHPGDGSFRTFLMKGARFQLSKNRAAARTVKRGGNHLIFSLDSRGAEDRFLADPVDPSNPEDAFDRAWALTVVEEASNHLQAEYKDRDQSQLFGLLQPFLLGSGGKPHADLVEALGMNGNSFKVAVHRMRRRFKKHLCNVVEHTLNSDKGAPSQGEVESEIGLLVSALGAAR
jgi:RNA polymerase sigma-70 factor (ECF subfamily)